MNIMVIVKASAASESQITPDPAAMHSMGEYNRALSQAGILVAAHGLKPSAQGVRVTFNPGQAKVSSGPFTATEELVGGFWIWQVGSMEEAIAWVKKCPVPDNTCIEIRPFYTAEDFAPSQINAAEPITTEHSATAPPSMAVKNYLFFSGRCEEAIAYYQQHLNARVDFLMRFNESPEAIPEGVLQEGFAEKIMHAQFSVGDVEIFASDGCNDASEFSGFRLALTIADEAAVRRIFAALAKGGRIDMPLTPTFWSPLYGQVTDQFGVGWMLMLPGEAAG